MQNTTNSAHALFDGGQLVARGPLPEVARQAAALGGIGAEGRPLLVLSDITGETLDLDLRGDETEVLERLQARFPDARGPEEELPRERGRPRLGVVAREVTLLPRHWEWLATQRGGASQALRRLVDEARQRDDGAGQARQRREAQYKAMVVLAGDLPGFEEASRALFAGDLDGLAERMRDWPKDLRDYLISLSAKSGD